MLQVWLLGQFEVRVEGKRAVIPSRAAQSLLAFLLLTAGTLHRREKLAGMLWPEMSDENARHNFRHELWRVRKSITPPLPTIPEYIVSEDFTIGFNSNADFWLDAAQLQRTLDNPSTEERIRQVALYHGELLPGFYDEWVALERERIAGVFEQRMQQLLGQLISEGQWHHVVEWGDRWIALGQKPEPAYRGLMRAYAAQGEVAKAALAYERCVEALRNDLGVEPSAETRTLFDELVRGQKSAQPMLTPMSPVIIQPSGTVTFLFSDIEGSTKLLEELGEEYATLLADHRDLLHSIAEKYNGHEIDTQGDAFFFAFFRAADAVAFAADAQRALVSHPWPRSEQLRVRMGLHTGEPMLARTGYVGMDVHRAARIGAAGHGGQVLLSQATRSLVENELPSGTSLNDLGDYRLKDLRYPVHIVQLTIEGLPSDFPPLKSLQTGSEPPAPGEPPFKGLEFFDEADAELFFGREPIVSKLVGDLRENRFLAVVVGASGSGKSSVVRAGLIPALRRGEPLLDGTLPPDDSRNWQVYVMTPTAHPLEALAMLLTRDAESVTATATLMDDLARDPRSLALYLGRKTLTLRQTAPFRPQHFVLVVDQFEELFTLCHSDFEREAFLDNLMDAVTLVNAEYADAGRSHRVTLIVTIRADFYAHLAQYPELRDAVAANQKYIGPMTVEELRRAIEQPALRGGWELEPGLVDLMLRDVGDEPGALPLLSHALLETWKRRSGHTITLKGYHEAGGVRGAIAQTAETTYQQLTPEQQVIARNILLRLTELGEGTEDTRRRASYSELIPQGQDGSTVRTVLTRLADARLITTGKDSAEVAHEALIREWPRLREWLDDNREGLMLQRHLTEAAHEWDLMEQDPSMLYRGIRLAQAVEFASLNPEAPNAHERAFLDASVENEKREEREREAVRQRELLAKEQLLEAEQARVEVERKANQRLRLRAFILAGVLILAVLAAAAAVFFGNRANANALAAEQNAQAAGTARDEAKHQERLATARELAASADNNLTVDTERSLLLALQAVNATAVDKTVMPEAASALHRAVLTSHALKMVTGHTKPVYDVTFNPDGTRFATNSSDGTTRVWDALTYQELFQIPHPEGWSFNVFFSADGKQIATMGSGADEALTLKLWDARSGRLIKTTQLPLKSEGWQRNALDPEWARLAITQKGGKTFVFDVETGKELLDFRLDVDHPYQVRFSPDGKQLAISSHDGTAGLWDSQTGKHLFTFKYKDQVISVAYNADGTRLAVASFDGTAGIWDTEKGTELFKFEPRIGSLNSIAWNRDGTQLAAVGWNRTAVVWDATTGAEVTRFYGHTDRMEGVAFAPDGETLITTSDDNNIMVWSIAPDKEILTIPSKDFLLGLVEYSPDGSRIMVGKPDSALVVDAHSAKQLFELSGHQGWVSGIGFSSDGTKMATGDDYGTVKIWQAGTGKELLTFNTGQGSIYHLTFSPDGSQVATSGSRMKIWDVATGKELYTFSGEGFASFAYSPDGSLFAGATGDGETTVWQFPTGNTLVKLQDANPSGIYDVQFSPDGKRITTANGNGTAQVWDISEVLGRGAGTAKELLRLKGHASDVFKSVFTRDGKEVITASSDGTAKIWDAESGKELFTIPINQGSIYGMALHPDGNHVALGTDHAIFVVTRSIDELVALAKAKLTRTWTLEECQKFLHLNACAPQSGVP